VVWPAAEEGSLASDNFESGGWAGGTHWLDTWTNTGASSITGDGSPYAGSYHLLLQGPDGYAARAVDLSGQKVAHLRFWAKVNGFETGDVARCQVSSNGTDWQTVYTWGNANDDNTYHYYDIDLSGFSLTANFWIAFSAAMDEPDDYFCVDNISLDTMRAYCITVAAGDRTLKVAVDMTDGEEKILSWWYVV
jgi:hypothetical protein